MDATQSQLVSNTVESIKEEYSQDGDVISAYELFRDEIDRYADAGHSAEETRQYLDGVSRGLSENHILPDLAVAWAQQDLSETLYRNDELQFSDRVPESINQDPSSEVSRSELEQVISGKRLLNTMSGPMPVDLQASDFDKVLAQSFLQQYDQVRASTYNQVENQLLGFIPAFGLLGHRDNDSVTQQDIEHYLKTLSLRPGSGSYSPSYDTSERIVIVNGQEKIMSGPLEKMPPQDEGTDTDIDTGADADGDGWTDGVPKK